MSKSLLLATKKNPFTILELVMHLLNYFSFDKSALKDLLILRTISPTFNEAIRQIINESRKYNDLTQNHLFEQQKPEEIYVYFRSFPPTYESQLISNHLQKKGIELLSALSKSLADSKSARCQLNSFSALVQDNSAYIYLKTINILSFLTAIIQAVAALVALTTICISVDSRITDKILIVGGSYLPAVVLVIWALMVGISIPIATINKAYQFYHRGELLCHLDPKIVDDNKTINNKIKHIPDIIKFFTSADKKSTPETTAIDLSQSKH
jgi:hypothetical protein